MIIVYVASMASATCCDLLLCRVGDDQGLASLSSPKADSSRSETYSCDFYSCDLFVEIIFFSGTPLLKHPLVASQSAVPFVPMADKPSANVPAPGTTCAYNCLISIITSILISFPSAFASSAWNLRPSALVHFHLTSRLPLQCSLRCSPASSRAECYDCSLSLHHHSLIISALPCIQTPFALHRRRTLLRLALHHHLSLLRRCRVLPRPHYAPLSRIRVHLLRLWPPIL